MGHVVSGIIGGVASIFNHFEKRKEEERREALARQQLEAQRRAEEMARQQKRKAEARNPDVSGILRKNTEGTGLPSTNLTGANGVKLDPNKLNQGNSLLGG